MTRYFRLWFKLIKLSLMEGFEYRANVLLHILAKLLWTALTLIFFEVIYLHTDEIVGWNKSEVLILFGTFLVVRALFAAFFYDGPSTLPRLIQTGRLDLLLAKPVSSQFTISVCETDVGDLARLFLGAFLVLHSFGDLGITVGIGQMITYLLLIPASVMTFYSLYFMVLTTSIWLVRLDNAGEVINTIIFLGKFPVSVFPKTVSFLLTFVFPIAFAGTVPAEVLLGRVSWPLVFYGFGISVVLLRLSHRFWNFALKRYTSAGG